MRRSGPLSWSLLASSGLLLWIGCNDPGSDDDSSQNSPTPVDTPTPGGSPTPLDSPTPTSSPGPSPTLSDLDQDGYTEDEGDCDDEDDSIHPGASETPYDGIDQDCADGDLTDVDGDSYDGQAAGGEDCDDDDPYTHPGATEIGDGLDNDCDGEVDDGIDTVDNDGDGLSELDGDCNDEDDSIHPDATEIPYDGIDQDCSGADLTDVDGDGHAGTPAGGDDCNDEDSSIHPEATETPYDGIDQDCSGADLTDVDGDGAQGGPDGNDCNDEDSSIHPQATETAYDGIDQDCSGADLTDVDGDGHAAEVAGGDDCDDKDSSIHPDMDETPYDGIDQDCSGDDLTDVDGDGHEGTAVGGDDCDDQDVNSHPEAEEYADGKDNDCDGGIDEDLDSTDDDGDGASELDGDCDDYDDTVHPEATETPYDGIDQDCSGADLTDVDGDGFDADQAGGRDCDDNDPAINPDEIDVAYDGIDQDCSGADLTDVDGDGYTAVQAGGDDCDDADPQSHPTANEVPYDGIDQDCTGRDLTDVDGDLYESTAVGGLDCNDAEASISPDAAEVCDEIDNNCDNVVDTDAVDRETWYVDGDHDGYGDPDQPVLACEGSDMLIADNTDCDDTTDRSHPGADEACDGVDNNCDGSIDEGVQTTYYRDGDSDGYGDAGLTKLACTTPSGYVTDSRDCNDTDASIHPDATERCNLEDDDCDGQIDEEVQLTFYRDGDGDSYGNASQTTLACSAPTGYVANPNDCNDSNASINPGATEICDSVDNDCDGKTDDSDDSVTGQNTYYRDADGDHYGTTSSTTRTCASNAPAGYVANADDCNDGNISINPGATEICDSVDNDCDSKIDDNDDSVSGQNTYYRDADGDSYGISSTTTRTCASSAPSGYASRAGDCDDNNASVNPGASEVANGVDDDCDGTADDGVYFTSCKAILAAIPTSSSAVYTIDPDGSGSVAPFQAYCDMTTNGGGWTLAMKINGGAATFVYSSSHWTTGSTLNTNDPGFNTTEAKLMSYNTMSFTSVMIGMKEGSNAVRYLNFNHTGSSLLTVIGTGNFVRTSLGRDKWKTLVASPSLQRNCNLEGFNPTDGCFWDTSYNGVARVRIGIINNQENDCCSPDSRIGVGGGGSYCGQNPNYAAGNEARCDADAGDRSTPTFAYVYIR